MANDIALTASQRLGQFIEEATLNPDFDADKFERIVRLHLELQDRQDKGDFNEAFARVQARMEPVVRNAKGTSYMYATVDKLHDMLQPICTEEGFSVRFGALSGAPEGYIRKTITVAKGRYSETGQLDMPTSTEGSRGGQIRMNAQQAIGSASTYARRYLMLDFFNVTTTLMKGDDDDGAGGKDASSGGAGGATAGAGNGGTSNGPDVKTRFMERLTKMQTKLELSQFMAIPGTVKWRESVVPAARAEIDAAVAKRLAELPETVPTTTAPAESTPAEGQPSAEAAKMVVEIAAITDGDALFAWLTEASGRMVKLHADDARHVDEVYKARVAQLEVAGTRGAAG